MTTALERAAAVRAATAAVRATRPRAGAIDISTDSGRYKVLVIDAATGDDPAHDFMAAAHDLLTELFHLAESLGRDFDTVIDRARETFEVELAEQETAEA